MEPDKAVATSPPLNEERSIPGVLWIALVSLAVMTLFHLVLGLARPRLLLAALLDGALLWGLFRGFRWAYVLTVLFCGLGAAVSIARNLQGGLAVLLLNALVLVPVLLSTDYYFRKPR
jgi:hypothetical protein